ncbi:unnamed protein product [Prorocentrum cordatum]|uniref:Anoctamin transmembrane domain-containing protein n=1 Tax=Prorocentrum cordatum TaxID=2364126 RepID=A0ABN9TLP6_9DINO|nr:unnamed protein product [Polarella glacialis]
MTAATSVITDDCHKENTAPGKGSSGASAPAVEAVCKDLAEQHLEVTRLPAAEQGGRSGLGVSAVFEQLCLEAEHEGLSKRLSGSPFSDGAARWPAERFQFPAWGLSGEEVALAEFQAADGELFEGFAGATERGGPGPPFFEPWERLALTLRMLERAVARQAAAVAAAPARPRGAVPALSCWRCPEVGADGQTPLVQGLLQSGWLESVLPLHEAAAPLGWRTLAERWCLRGPLREAGIDDIHREFGDDVAYYFVFMRTFTVWLLPLAVLGPVACCTTWLLGDSVDDSLAMPFYALLVVLWASLFPRLTERADSHFACRWGRWHLFADRVGISVHESPLRPTFRAEINPLTGEVEYSFPRWRRWPLYARSAAVTSIMLCVAFAVMVCSLNLQGAVQGPDDARAQGFEKSGSRFHVPCLAAWARPGQILDPTGEGDPLFFGYITLIPVVLHVIGIAVLNAIYRRVATALTEGENHRTEADFHNALVIKRFLFEAFDAYIALFYIAFYERDPVSLQWTLRSLYTADVVRRVLLETVLPLVGLQVGSWRRIRSSARRKKDEDGAFPSRGAAERWELEAARGELEDFGDYLEMVIEFGYVTLFASAFPLAACLSVCANVVEVHSDAVRLRHALRRPPPMAAGGMPPAWRTVIRSICWLSVLTNVLLFGFSSQQMMQFFPSFFKELDADEHKVRQQGVWVLFGLENVLLAMCTGLSLAVRREPKWVWRALRGRELRVRRALVEARCR